jgi:hypothetical protein
MVMMATRRPLGGWWDGRARGPSLAGALAAALVLCGTLAPRRASGAATYGAVRLTAFSASAGVEALRGGDAAAWAAVPAAPIDLQRTPPLYEGDPLDDGARPDASVSIARAGDRLMVRLAWTDSTEDALSSPTSYPDAGGAAIYKKHSRDIERFADAACLMLPRVQGPREAFPSLMMGEPGETVDLYLWNNSRGFEHLQAAGRGTTSPTGNILSGTASRVSKGWVVVFDVPVPAPGTPCSFAVWDGAREHRDGLKFFSIWYEIFPEGGP